MIQDEDIAADTNQEGVGAMRGCYLVVSSPKDHEITTTFPLPYSHGFYAYGQENIKSQELNSIEGDIFSWDRCEFVSY